MLFHCLWGIVMSMWIPHIHALHFSFFSCSSASVNLVFSPVNIFLPPQSPSSFTDFEDLSHQHRLDHRPQGRYWWPQCAPCPPTPLLAYPSVACGLGRKAQYSPYKRLLGKIFAFLMDSDCFLALLSGCLWLDVNGWYLQLHKQGAQCPGAFVDQWSSVVSSLKAPANGSNSRTSFPTFKVACWASRLYWFTLWGPKAGIWTQASHLSTISVGGRSIFLQKACCICCDDLE